MNDSILTSIPILRQANCSCAENLFNTWSGLLEKYLIPIIRSCSIFWTGRQP